MMASLLQHVALLSRNTGVVIGCRHIKRWVAPTLRELYRRRKSAGHVAPNPRSTYLEWNYNAELFAFAKRLNEDLQEESLRTAFIHQSYLDQEEQRRKELQIQEVSLELVNNETFVQEGLSFTSKYIKGFLRFSFPYLPEEGILAVHDFLMSEDILSYVASNIGVSDLILCADYPPETATLAKTFSAVIGAILKDESEVKAELFIQDLLLTQLIGRDVNELWPIINPMGVLIDILKRSNLAPPEPRLLREAGKNTILAVYYVGIYSDQKFLGMAPGETLDIAEEMAARNCLMRFFGTTLDSSPLPFGEKGHKLKINTTKTNLRLKEWTLAKAKISKQEQQKGSA